MRILMPVTHNAVGGGLLDHVRALAKAAPNYGNEVTVAARPSTFLQELDLDGIDTIALDFTMPEASIETLRASGCQWDLIHAHPFEAREFAQVASAEFDIPLVVTIHGWYDDHIERWYPQATAVIAVSPSIATRLSTTVPGSGDKIVVIPNGIKAAHLVDVEAAKTLPLRVAVASRLDRDSGRLIQLIEEFILAAQKARDTRWLISIAGAGTDYKAIVSRISQLVGDQIGPSVEFLGWLNDRELNAMNQESFAAIAPGRSAIDAMASGLPTLMTRQIGTYSSFTGDGALSHYYGEPKDFSDGAAFYGVLARLASDPDTWDDVSARLARATSLLYDNEVWQQMTNAVYEFAALGSVVARSSTPGSSR